MAWPTHASDEVALRRLGRAIRLARLGHGMSQMQLERASGVGQSTISRLERGLVPNMALVRLARIGAALPLSPFYGLSDDENPVHWPRLLEG